MPPYIMSSVEVRNYGNLQHLTNLATEMVQRIERNGATETTRLLPTRVDDDSSCISRVAVQRWSSQIGIALAVLSGFLFTANNFLVQYFAIGALEMLLVRSVVQVNMMGLWVAVRGTSLSPSANSTWIFVAAQAFLSSITLYLAYRYVLQ